MRPVVNFGTVAQRRDIPLNRLRQAKELERLVDQMRAQVKPQAAPGDVLFAPAHAHFRAEAVNMRLQMFNLAERALLNDLLNAEEIAVPAAVMEYGEQKLLFVRQRNQVAGFPHVEGKRLIHNHVFTRVQGQRRQRGVRGVRGGDHHQVNIRMLDGLLRRRHHLDVRQIAFHLLFIT